MDSTTVYWVLTSPWGTADTREKGSHGVLVDEADVAANKLENKFLMKQW